MKHSQIIILIAIGAAVLVTAIGIGFYIGRASEKDKQAGFVTGTEANKGQLGRGINTLQASREKVRNLSEEERAGLLEERQKIMEGWKDMPEEKKQQFRAQLRESFNARRRAETERIRTLTPEEKARLEERLKNMSEQERRELSDKIRKGSNVLGQEPNIVRQEPNAATQKPNIVR